MLLAAPHLASVANLELRSGPQSVQTMRWEIRMKEELELGTFDLHFSNPPQRRSTAFIRWDRSVQIVNILHLFAQHLRSHRLFEIDDHGARSEYLSHPGGASSVQQITSMSD